MTPKQRRGFSIAAIACLLVVALMLVLGALRDNIVFFYSPSEIDRATPGKAIRLGGLVKEGSVTPPLPVNGSHSGKGRVKPRDPSCMHFCLGIPRGRCLAGRRRVQHADAQFR